MIFLISIIITAKKGFLNSIIGVAAFALSLVVAISISSPISDFVYNNFVREAAYESAATVIENAITDTDGIFRRI